MINRRKFLTKLATGVGAIVGFGLVDITTKAATSSPIFKKARFDDYFRLPEEETPLMKELGVTNNDIKSRNVYIYEKSICTTDMYYDFEAFNIDKRGEVFIEADSNGPFRESYRGWGALYATKQSLNEGVKNCIAGAIYEYPNCERVYCYVVKNILNPNVRGVICNFEQIRIIGAL